jgi:O-antigen/teichoic acid export membrane protein
MFSLAVMVSFLRELPADRHRQASYEESKTLNAATTGRASILPGVTATPRSAFRRDVLAAYVASGSRLLSWIIVTSIVYRRMGAPAFAVLALVRTTIGLLNYTAVGLAPATIRLLAREPDGPAVYSSSTLLAALSAAVASVVAVAYALAFRQLHAVPAALAGADLRPFVLTMGLGTVFRMCSEAFGAALQVRGRIALDNLLVAGAELLWMLICLAPINSGLNRIGMAWLASGVALAVARGSYAQRIMGGGAFALSTAHCAMMKKLLAFGLLVALAQAADFLYAPTDNILINRFISPVTVAVYAPAIQIDAGLLLLVGGLAAVLFPYSALAAREQVRHFYITGTVVSLALLLPAAAIVWLLSAPLFHLWLGDSLPATRAILPLVLIHTVVGGSSAVGRSVLLAVGKVRPFTAAVLVAGTANVLLSFIFVRYFNLGLTGIVLGTILAVVGRCAVWTPWYVLKTLGSGSV